MRIGVITDDQNGHFALSSIFQKIQVPGVQILRPSFANMQPKATPMQIAKAALDRINLMSGKGVERIVLLIDLEDQQKCCGEFASEIEVAVKKLVGMECAVVIKHRTLENWLVADPASLKRMTARFEIPDAFVKAVSPDKADRVYAEKLLTKHAKGSEYHKRDDARRIGELIEPLEIARNSRSFRRFLRVIGHPLYKEQSRRPQAPTT